MYIFIALTPLDNVCKYVDLSPQLASEATTLLIIMLLIVHNEIKIATAIWSVSIFGVGMAG